MFDQADGLSASVEAEDYDDIKGDIEQKVADDAGGTSISDLALEEDLSLDMALEEADINIVDELKPEEEPEEKEGLEGEIDKEMSNKDKIMNDREKFGAGVEGDLTGRNKAYDSFKIQKVILYLITKIYLTKVTRKNIRSGLYTTLTYYSKASKKT